MASVEQRVCICALPMQRDGLRYLATLLPLFYDWRCCLSSLFSFYPHISLHEVFRYGRWKGRHLSSRQIVESKLDNRGLFEENTCAHSSRMGFTWLQESLCSHSEWVFGQMIKPGYTSCELLEHSILPCLGWRYLSLVQQQFFKPMTHWEPV